MQRSTDAAPLLERELQPQPAAAPTAPLRIGVVGLGAVAQSVHLPLLAKHRERFRIEAICDLSAATREAIGDRLGVPPERRHGDSRELLAAGGLDALAICSSGSHGALAAAAARAGLAVFCEKPLAYTLAECDELAALAPRLQLGYMKLYDPAVERARALLADRPAARAVDVTVLHPPAQPQLAHAGLLPPPGDVGPDALGQLSAGERAQLERALGSVPAELATLYADVLLGSVVHDLAVLRFLLGGPLRVEDAETWGETSVAIRGQLPGGTHVSVQWHYLDRYPAYREEVRVHSDGGTVSLTFPSPYLLHAPTTLAVVDGDAGDERATTVRSTVEAFERQWLAFSDFARGGTAPRAGIAEGRADIVACQAAAAALADRQGVAIGGEAAEARSSDRGAAVGATTTSMAPGPKEGAL